jgi:hypothetical protein
MSLENKTRKKKKNYIKNLNKHIEITLGTKLHKRG